MSAPVNTKYCGFAPKIIKVDLTREKIITIPLTLDLAQNYIGGRGINSKILFDEVPAKIDPFHPENRVIFGVGPLNGTLSPSSGRFTVTAKSPLTSGFGDANCGGEFAAEMKFAGYSTIVFSGKAKKPVYLWIDDDNVSVEKASGLWGLNSWETEEEIQQTQGDPEIQVACIGQAGENKIRYACVMHQLGRAAGRSGMGAVMGSKNLKAVAIRGTGGVTIAHPQALEDTVLEAQKKLQRDVFYRLYADYGTPGLMTLYNEYGGNASYNNKETQVDWIDEMSGERFVEKYKVKTQACYSCPLHCDIFYRVDTGKYACYGNSMEYENMTAFGTRCGNRSLEAVLKASTLSDHYGLDVISCGATISWAFESFEKGILTPDQTDGLILEWGNSDAVIELVEKIAFRQGIGDLLAEGSYRAAQKTGKGSNRLLSVVKKMEVPAVDPRAFSGYGALGYAVASRGGDHLRALAASSYMMDPETAEEYFGSKSAADRFSPEGQGKLVSFHEDMRAIADSGEICKYITRTALLFPEPLVKLFDAVTGWKMKPHELQQIGERIVNIERAFNVREGFTRKDDYPSYRLLKEPIPSGPAKGHYIAEWLDKMLDDFYTLREWDVKTGIPTKKKLDELGIGYVHEQFPKQKDAVKTKPSGSNSQR